MFEEKEKTKPELDDLNPDLFYSAMPSIEDDVNEANVPALSKVPDIKEVSDTVSTDDVDPDVKSKYPRELVVRQLRIERLFPHGKFLIYRSSSGILEIYGGFGPTYKFPVFETNVQESLFDSDIALKISAVLGAKPLQNNQVTSSIQQNPTVSSSSNASGGLEPLLELYSHNVLGDASFYFTGVTLTIDGEHPVYRPLHAKVLKQASEMIRQWLNNASAHGSLDCSCEKVTLKVKRLDSRSRRFWSKLGYDNTVPKNFTYASSKSSD